MHHAFAVALTFVALLPLPGRAQETSTAFAVNPIPFTSVGAPATEDVLSSWAGASSRHTAGRLTYSSALSAMGVRELEPIRAGTAPSLSRHLRVGAGIGGAVGAAFGLWVITIADCGGPNCTTERVLGVASNAVGGAAIGALIGGAVYLIRK